MDYPPQVLYLKAFFLRGKLTGKKILFDISKNEKTTIIYESPKRLSKLLQELLEFCGEDREIMIARELTKKFEEHVGNNIINVIEFFRDKDIIGEITIVIKGIRKRDYNPNKSIIKKDLNDLIDAGLSLSANFKILGQEKWFKEKRSL